MKLFVFVLFFMMTINNYSQKKTNLSIYIDPKMLIYGPYMNDKKGALDILSRFYISKNKNEYGLELEYFNRIHYLASGLFYSRQILKIKKTYIYTGGNIGFIFRTSKYNTKTPSFSINCRIKYKLTNKLSISLLANYKHRSDLVKLYNNKKILYFNGYIGLNYLIHS
ncbi:hypothetical protein [Wenyingzhuangia marina]|uniref:Outer membrane protein beta-barrel domain-containing protein n=1 Tax=Wenyingzhuangia marina TaxID=1195760 RepID=A0A1M5WPF2_9FLAO|nr:hypothetical protein [Wenyingzhuangia marina]GGF79437.1 hypothetical protein GCM10011397_23100 [Wenyingzhuangia marina]SHH88893.1 hypothetical protein SAMN05444281_2518 [Wenyingzhuangia marina]